MKKTRWILLFFVLLLVAVVLVRTLRFHSRQIQSSTAPSQISVDADAAVQRLAEVLRFQTVSSQDPAATKGDEFVQLHAYLEEQFPAIHASLQRETVQDFSLLYTWKGQDPSLRPVLLMGHLDVVPVEPGTESRWQQSPFGGRVEGGFVWGRGSLDDKSSSMAILEAVEQLVASGFQPKRTVYLAFGHNEEVLGSGAKATADLLKQRGIQLESVLDEGQMILEGLIPGLDAPVAAIGIAEKGYMSVRLTVTTEGGHSSMPPRETAVGILSRAIVELEKRPVPARLDGPAVAMLEYVGPEMSFGPRMVLSNLWLFGPVVRFLMASRPSSDAMIRTTTAPTMFQGSQKENVLPATATAVVNFRILPGDTSADILDHVRNAIRDERVKIDAITRGEPSPVSPVDSPSFRMLQMSIREEFPAVVVAPSLVIGATDARYYREVSTNIYRFVPFPVGKEDLARVHGTNERIGVQDYVRGIRFYVRLLRNTAGEGV